MSSQPLGILLGAWWAWPLALALYVLFRAWYDNWRGPLTKAEIDAFLAHTASKPTNTGHFLLHAKPSALRTLVAHTGCISHRC
jgi:hypothetical protein